MHHTDQHGQVHYVVDTVADVALLSVRAAASVPFRTSMRISLVDSARDGVTGLAGACSWGSGTKYEMTEYIPKLQKVRYSP